MVLVNLLQVINSAWPAGLIMVALGSGAALILLVASERLKVWLEPKIEQVTEALPGLDCGACGYAGCVQYAKAVCSNPELLGKCAPGGAESADRIAKILNLQIGESVVARRPVVHCRAQNKDKVFYGAYCGVDTCVAADALPNAQACTFGCLGYGDCVDACRFGAIDIVNGLAIIDYVKCTGCGACACVCPRKLIEMVPFSRDSMVVVACNSRESGKVTRSMCNVGCIGCKLCEKKSGAFSVSDNLARIDYAKYEPDEGTKAAQAKCPTGVIVYRGEVNAPPNKSGS